MTGFRPSENCISTMNECQTWHAFQRMQPIKHELNHDANTRHQKQSHGTRVLRHLDVIYARACSTTTAVVSLFKFQLKNGDNCCFRRNRFFTPKELKTCCRRAEMVSQKKLKSRTAKMQPKIQHLKIHHVLSKIVARRHCKLHLN